jgi:hypothetical protein
MLCSFFFICRERSTIYCNVSPHLLLSLYIYRFLLWLRQHQQNHGRLHIALATKYIGTITQKNLLFTCPYLTIGAQWRTIFLKPLTNKFPTIDMESTSDKNVK